MSDQQDRKSLGTGIKKGMAWRVFSNEAHAFDHTPDPLKTFSMCLAVVSSNGMKLKHVPARLRTVFVVLLAVSEEGMALEFVPEPLKSLDLCKAALVKRCCAWDFVPQKIKTVAFCEEVAALNTDLLTHIPNDLISAERKAAILAAHQQPRAKQIYSLQRYLN